MTRRVVLEQTSVFAIGYLLGLGALSAWPNRQTLNQDAVFLVGITILIVAAVVLDWLLFKRRPSFGFRPARYSIPNFFGVFGALLFQGSLSGGNDQDRGLIGYAVAMLLIFVGVTASNFWWAHATEPGPGDGPQAEGRSPPL